MNKGKSFQTQICADQGNAHQRVQTQVARSRSGAGRRASTSRSASSGKSSTRIEPPLISVQLKPPQRAALSQVERSPLAGEAPDCGHECKQVHQQ